MEFLPKKVKQAGCNKRAGWNLSQKKLNKQDLIRDQGGNHTNYRVVKRNCQVVRFRDFEHMRTRMAQVFCITSRHNIYLLIQSKKLRSEATTSPES